MIISIGNPPRIESVFGEKSKIELLQSVPFQPELHLHSRLLNELIKQYPFIHPQLNNFEQSFPSYLSSQSQYDIGNESKFCFVNEQIPLFEQSFNDEQFGNSQFPFEFLNFPSSHLLLHSPVFTLPIYFILFYLLIINIHERQKKKKKKKKRKTIRIS